MSLEECILLFSEQEEQASKDYVKFKGQHIKKNNISSGFETRERRKGLG